MYRKLGGPQDRSGWVQKILPPAGIRSPNRPARSESLYMLNTHWKKLILWSGTFVVYMLEKQIPYLSCLVMKCVFVLVDTKTLRIKVTRTQKIMLLSTSSCTLCYGWCVVCCECNKGCGGRLFFWDTDSHQYAAHILTPLHDQLWDEETYALSSKTLEPETALYFL